jgi:hypothetical protein
MTDFEINELKKRWGTAIRPSISDSFDQKDMANVGRPLYWKLENHIAAIEQLIRADELQMAIQMLDMVPGWWRDNYPKELTEIKKTIYRQTYDQIEYATDDEEADCPREMGEGQWTGDYCYPRAEVLETLIKSLKPHIPWIYDLGCSHGNMPLGLIKAGIDFSYKGVGMNHRIVQKLKGWVGEKWSESPLETQPTILYCTEVLEHLMNPMDIVHSAFKIGVDFDSILLSVPMYCLGAGLPDWSTRRMGHVRNWSPMEFQLFAMKNWPGYTWTLYKSNSMVLTGFKNKVK